MSEGSTTENRKIEVCFSPGSYYLYENPQAIVVVIDILRATSAICTAFQYGVKCVIPVASVQEAKEYKDKGYLVGAERNGTALDGFDFGNSPFSYMTEKILDKTVVITTTNGTRAIDVSKEAYQVIIGSFLNITALCNYLILQNRPVLLLCSGWKDRFNLEDALFAGAVTDVLSSNPMFTEMSDSALAAKFLFQSAKEDTNKFLRNSSHRKRLAELGLKEDIKYCLSLDKTDIIPVLNNGILQKLDVLTSKTI
jgi:2-phosphosulfolactate phosphatase